MRNCLVLLLLCAVAGWAQQPAGNKAFGLGDHATVQLEGRWTERGADNLPPPFLLAGSAPRLVFSELLVLENRDAWEVLKLGISENPFIGSNPAALEDQMHNKGLEYLFYFFFPPSKNCLARTKASLEAAEAAEEARHRDDDKKERSRQKVSITQKCEPAATAQDFFAAQVSSGLSFNSESKAQPQFLSFYIPPTERMEMNGKTFFIFEAQAQKYVERADLDFFNLPDDRQGSRAYLFWAVGADSPFPFVFDPTRKNVQLVHMAYACLNSTGLARPAFLDKLKAVRFAR